MIARTTSFPAKLGLTALAAAALVFTGTALHGNAHADSTDASALTLLVSDTTIQAPATIAPGLERFTIVNSGAQPHDLSLLRIDDGVSFDQVMAAGAQAASGDPRAKLAFAALITPAGGVEMIEPGATAAFSVELSTGSYLAIDLGSVADGTATRFAVAGSPAGTTVPDNAVTVKAVDFGYQLPATVAAGKTTFAFANTGTQNHEFGLALLDPDYTLQDVLAHVADDAPPAWIHPVPGIPDIAPGLTEWQTLDLAPGTYVAICFDTNPATGAPHAALGMIGTFIAQ